MKGSAESFFIRICNPHAVGRASSRGVASGADDVQGLPFFLDILSTVKIAKNPEGDLALGIAWNGARPAHRGNSHEPAHDTPHE